MTEKKEILVDIVRNSFIEVLDRLGSNELRKNFTGIITNEVLTLDPLRVFSTDTYKRIKETLNVYAGDYVILFLQDIFINLRLAFTEKEIVELIEIYFTPLEKITDDDKVTLLDNNPEWDKDLDKKDLVNNYNHIVSSNEILDSVIVSLIVVIYNQNKLRKNLENELSNK